MLANFSWEIDNSCETCYVDACIYMNMKLNLEKFYKELLTSLGNVYLNWKLMGFQNYRRTVDCFWKSTVWAIKYWLTSKILKLQELNL